MILTIILLGPENGALSKDNKDIAFKNPHLTSIFQDTFCLLVFVFVFVSLFLF